MLSYVGGKCRLAKWIISNFPENYTEMHYAEVFGGAGWVLFKKEKSFLETYNDLDKNLVSFFSAIRDDYEHFRHLTEWTLHSREQHKEANIKLSDPELAEMDRALSFAITRNQSFSGDHSWGYRLQPVKPYSGQWAPLLKRLPLIKSRLQNVQIECLDYKKFIQKYDTANTLFYCDPPYVNYEFYYNAPFTRNDHIELANLLKQIKGKFALSYYDDPLIRELYKGFNIQTKTSSKSSVGVTKINPITERPKSFELLIMNY